MLHNAIRDNPEPETFWKVSSRMGFRIIPEDEELAGFWQIYGKELDAAATGDAAQMRQLARLILEHVPEPDPETTG